MDKRGSSIVRASGCVLMACLLLSLPAPAAAQSFTRLVVFGTSLSDPGNAFAIYGGNNTPPDYEVDELLIPPAQVPYARGGHHFSNGATWVEQLGRSLGLAASVKPAFKGSNAKATNYAVAAARAYDDGVNVNLPRQVETFLAESGAGAPADTLYVIEMGGNDVRDAMGAYLVTLQQTGNPDAAMADAQRVLTSSIESIGRHIFALWRSGARQFLVWNAPDLSLTPAVQRLNLASPGAAALAQGLSVGFNMGLQDARGETGLLPGLRESLPDIEIRLFNVFDKIYEVIGNAPGFGLTDVKSACITPGVAPFHCQNPDEHLFWDGIHPTQAMHGIIAQLVAAELVR